MGSGPDPVNRGPGRSPHTEVRGSNSRAPTGDLQGFLPRHSPPRPPFAVLLQPKCLGMLGHGLLRAALLGTGWDFARRPEGAGGSGRGRTHVYETYGVKQAREWLGHSDPATTLRHYVRFTTAARAKAVAGLDEMTRAALESAERRAVEDAQPARDNVVSLASRRS